MKNEFGDLIPITVYEDLDGFHSYHLSKDVEVRGHNFRGHHMLRGGDIFLLHKSPVRTSVGSMALMRGYKSLDIEEVPNAFLQRSFEDYLDTGRKKRLVYFARLESIPLDEDTRRILNCPLSVIKFSSLVE